MRSHDINAYLKESTGLDISAKDFRTWGATVMASVALAVAGPAAGTKTGRKRAITRAIKEVAYYLGNTPAVARASYIDPRVFDRYRDGIVIAVHDLEHEPEGTAIQGEVEEAVLDLITGSGKRASPRPRPGRDADRKGCRLGGSGFFGVERLDGLGARRR